MKQREGRGSGEVLGFGREGRGGGFVGGQVGVDGRHARPSPADGRHGTPASCSERWEASGDWPGTFC